MNIPANVQNELDNIEAVSGCSNEEYLGMISNVQISTVERTMLIIDSDGDEWRIDSKMRLFPNMDK